MKKNTEEKMVQKRRVVITGLGAVTPIGNTVPEFWTNVRKGTVGIGEITGFDTKDFKVKLAAQVKDFHGEEKMDVKAARRGCRTRSGKRRSVSCRCDRGIRNWQPFDH